MNSSKVRVISFLSKETVFSLGEALIKTGGIESLAPPVGLALLAQAIVLNKINPKKTTESVLLTFFILFGKN